MPSKEKWNVIGCSLLFASSLLLPRSACSQAIPVELTGGHRYATINLVMSRGFTATSRSGFFHQNTITVDYDDEEEDGIATQNLLFFEPLEGFRLTGGAFYGGPGFSPTAGMQYVNAGRTSLILISPRVNIESDPSFSIFSVVRYKPDIAANTKLYLGAQLLNTFDTSNHIKSYQWLRAGLDIKVTQFGVAANLDEFGPHPDLRLSMGVFVRREIP